LWANFLEAFNKKQGKKKIKEIDARAITKNRAKLEQLLNTKK